LKIAPDSRSSLRNFPAVAEFPDTEESRAVAAAVRSSVSALAPFNGPAERAWPEYFWQRGLELEPCETFHGGEDNAE
jgi:hypothetical protein